MALIVCPECNKEISDKAKVCPSCGFPIESIDEIKLDFPLLPSNLNIGEMFTNWAGDTSIEGTYERAENAIQSIPTSKVRVSLHSHGIAISGSLFATHLEIHNSQIINLQKTTKAELVTKSRSVVGRAVVGGLIMGPLGVAVGGLSGIGGKQKMEDKSYLVINYWDVPSKSAQTLLVGADPVFIDGFIRRFDKNKGSRITMTAAKPEDSSGLSSCGVIIILLIVVALIYFILL